MDLHAHAGKRGCFIYGNHFDDLETQVKAMTYPKLIAMNTLNFDFDECNFTEKLMTKKDKSSNNNGHGKDLKTREGAGRVAIHKDCGNLVYTYTMECNYWCGSKLNTIPKWLNPATNKQMKEKDPLLDPNYKHYELYHKQLQLQGNKNDNPDTAVVLPFVHYTSAIMN